MQKQKKMKINVLIPFRDRDEDIKLSLPKINDSLIALGLTPTFFIAEQANDLPFNRGMIFNAGFLEAKKITDCSHWIFHDVDIFEKTPGHLKYGRVDGVRHVYGMEWSNLGGIFCIDSKTYELANGYSNNFWGWGKEDDDLRNRLNDLGIKIDTEGRILRRKRDQKMILDRVTPPDLKRERINYELMAARQDASLSGLSNADYQLVEHKEKKENVEWFMLDLKPTASLISEK